MRPTAGKVRSAIFNLLAARYEVAERRILDLFAGSGALGLDALSRAAAFVVFVDQSRDACRTVRENLERSGFADRAEVRRLTLPRGLPRLAAAAAPFHGVFVDPPYRRGLSAAVLKVLGEGSLVAAGAWVVVEHAREEALDEAYGRLRRADWRRYGSTAISVYLAAEAE